MNKYLTKFIQIFQVRSCTFCGTKSVVKCTGHDGRIHFLCSDCLRSIRFREKEFYKSIRPYGTYGAK